MSVNGGDYLARSLYDAVAARAFDTATESLSDDVLVLNVATGDLFRGKSGFLEYARGWAAAFPDLRYRLLEIAATEHRIVAEYELAGTHTGPMVTPRGHLPPTGMEMQVRFCDVLEVTDGKVTHIRSYFDSVTLLRQLGLVANTPIHAPDRRAPLELYAQTVESHAPQRNKAVVQRFLQDVFNRQNPGAVADTCAKQYTWHGGSMGEAHTLASYQHVLATFFMAFPDLQIEVLDSVAEGDRVVIRFSMCGTHLGEFQGIAPTFKRITGGGTNTYRLEDSRIIEEWWHGDVLAVLQQMDAVPSRIPLSP